MAETLNLVHDVLEIGMTTNRLATESWYIKTWYLNKQLAFDYRALPLAMVTPDDEHREDQYVQEDTEVDLIVVYFFPQAVDRAQDIDVPNASVVAMIDRASVLLRADPTLGEEVYDGQITGATFRQPGFTDGGVVHSAELRYRAKRRAPW